MLENALHTRENESRFKRSAPVVAGGVVAGLLACAKVVAVVFALSDPADDSFFTSALLGIDVLLALAFAALAAGMVLHRRAGFARVRVPAVAVLVLQPMYFLVYAMRYLVTFLNYPRPLAWFAILEYYGIPLLLGLLVLGLFLRAVLTPARPRFFLPFAVSIAFGYGAALNVYTLFASLSYWTTYAHGFKLFAQFAFIGFHALVLLPILLFVVSLASAPAAEAGGSDATPAPVEVPVPQEQR